MQLDTDINQTLTRQCGYGTPALSDHCGANAKLAFIQLDDVTIDKLATVLVWFETMWFDCSIRGWFLCVTIKKKWIKNSDILHLCHRSIILCYWYWTVQLSVQIEQTIYASTKLHTGQTTGYLAFIHFACTARCFTCRWVEMENMTASCWSATAT